MPERSLIRQDRHCDFYMLDDYRLGNFNQDLLDVIDEKREEIGFISRSRKIPEGCAACPHRIVDILALKKASFTR